MSKKVRSRRVVPEREEVRMQLEEERQDQEELDQELRELLGEDDSQGGIPDDDFFEEFRRDLARLMAKEEKGEE
mgnify:CR=1 FL=1